MSSGTMRRITEVNKELWLVLSLFVIVAVLNTLIASHRMVLGLYTLPTMFSAYYYGRRHATLTAIASMLLVIGVTLLNPILFTDALGPAAMEKWFDLAVWGGILAVTAYAMGTLCDLKEKHLSELRATYYGVLTILCQFISKDLYTANHSHRVSIYAAKIASYLGLPRDRVEDVRAAGLLHDIGKLEISRELLYKAARLDDAEIEQVRRHADMAADFLHPLGGSMRRIIPIVLAHHDRYDGNGYHPTVGEDIPLEARIIAVADVYDALTSDRPYRKAMSPYDAREVIAKGAGTEFDPHVVEAFLAAFRSNDLELPELLMAPMPALETLT